MVDVRKPKTFIKAGYIPQHETAILIHGFNGTQTSQHIMYLKDGNLSHITKTFMDQRSLKIDLFLQLICHGSTMSLQVSESIQCGIIANLIN